MENKNNCLICGEELEYFLQPKSMKCLLCGGEFQANAACRAGHFICDSCHSKDAEGIVFEVCAGTSSRDPIGIIQSLMEQPAVHMHGPEHHFMVGAALLAAYRNSGGEINIRPALEEMLRRGKQVPGGTCGFWGCCGAGVSTGIFVSIITGATPLKKQEWGLANLMTSRALERIANCGGPRCCKRDSFLAVIAAVEFIKENFGIQMELPEHIHCGFSGFNNECLGKECPFNR